MIEEQLRKFATVAPTQDELREQVIETMILEIQNNHAKMANLFKRNKILMERIESLQRKPDPEFKVPEPPKKRMAPGVTDEKPFPTFTTADISRTMEPVSLPAFGGFFPPPNRTSATDKEPTFVTF